MKWKTHTLGNSWRTEQYSVLFNFIDAFVPLKELRTIVEKYYCGFVRSEKVQVIAFDDPHVAFLSVCSPIRCWLKASALYCEEILPKNFRPRKHETYGGSGFEIIITQSGLVMWKVLDGRDVVEEFPCFIVKYELA